MTTDPFTEAARAEAREYTRTPRMNVGTVRDRIAEAHFAGWEAARTHLATQEPYGPRMSPLGIPVGAKGVQEVWDAFVKPSQSDDAPPQSIEMRELMAILRWAYIVLDAKNSAARAALRDEEKR